MALAVAVATGRDDVLRPIPAPRAARQQMLGGAPEEPGPAHGHAVSAGKTFYAHQPHGGAAIEAAAGLAEIGGEAVLAEGVGHGPVLGYPPDALREVSNKISQFQISQNQIYGQLFLKEQQIWSRPSIARNTRHSLN
ncbi:hypothetical protein FQZ97_707370 [compost metagenome]